MRNNTLRSNVEHPRPPGPLPLALVGTSDAVARARAALLEAAPRRTPVLICCEPGCRPVEIARAVHPAPEEAVVAIDCSGTDAVALDRMLFGTAPARPMPQDLEVLGADSVLLGMGTLFLESVGEMPAAAQRRLARLLRDGEARTADSRDAVRIARRIVASASPDLSDDVRSGRFRQDLYRRLSADRIDVPPLRQRRQDLASIIDAMLPSVAADVSDAPSFTQPAITILAALPWNENLDELAVVLGRVLRGASGVVRQEDVLAHLPIDGAFGRPDLTVSLRDARQRFERDYIAAVLERHHWRMSDAARTLGIERANLYRKTRQLGITRAARIEQA